ncbi:MAG TPA: hypothetical protein VG935_00880 [Patescibacteria group bacterium]|nr:hypothetical protein [Patescibacteria group bacterium]
MDKLEKKHLQHVHELQAVEYSMKWYGWGSPIGLSIFFIALAVIAAIIRIVFFG